MNRIKMMLWGREVDLGITYDCYSNENVLKSQEVAVQEFLDNYEEVNSSLEQVKKYCLSKNRDEIGNDEIENIFKYVAPKYLFIPRNESRHVVAIMCNYKFDIESGIAIVYENCRLREIGKQEIIL